MSLINTNPASNSLLTPTVKGALQNNTGSIYNQHYSTLKTPQGNIGGNATGRYAQTHRTQELRDYSFEELIKLIEQLERENAELRDAL